MYKPLLILLILWLAMPAMMPARADQAPFALSGEVKVTKVVDGDSLRSGRLKIRLHGIDAPERKQTCMTATGTAWPCGSAATDAIGEMVASAPRLSCALVDVDRYGRLVMRCHAGDVDIAEQLVAQGLAMAYRRYSTDYVAAEDAASRDRRGMWQGQFEAPWDWRRTN